MKKETLYGKEAREKVLAGVKKIAAAVKVTLGPLGRNVLIARQIYGDNYVSHSLPIHITKDGHTTAQSFDTEDSFEKVGVRMVKEAAQQTVNQAGDGTTTTVVLLESILEEGMKRVEAGENPVQLKREIDEEVAWVVKEVKKMAVQVGDNNDDILNIATISANNDPEMGKMIANAFKKIGKDGVIDIEASQSVKTEIKMADGYRLSQSWIHPLFITNKEKQIIEFENPLILLYEKIVLHHTQMERALLMARNANRPLVIICEDAKEEGLSFLLTNANVLPPLTKIPSVVVKSPSIGELRRLEMEDIALYTGGTYITDTKGVGIKEIEFENFGQADKVIINKDETVIIGGRSNHGEVEKQIGELQMDKARAKNEDEAAPIEKRIAKLKGGVAVIQVGAPTETEMKEKLDRFDDAVRATKSAIAEGYVAGGGSAFLNISGRMRPQGVVAVALQAPILRICENAGIDSDSILGEIVPRNEIGIGYNAKSGKIENLIETGVIDPAKVLRCALQNAASSATMILTSECVIADIP